MKQSPSWEANKSSASQEIPRILQNPVSIPRLLWLFRNVMKFLRRGIVSTSPNP